MKQMIKNKEIPIKGTHYEEFEETVTLIVPHPSEIYDILKKAHTEYTSHRGSEGLRNKILHN